VVPILMPHVKEYDPMWAAARTEILAHGMAREGSRVVVTCGVPIGIPGTTNLLKVETV
jgi:pyruvate kinase